MKTAEQPLTAARDRLIKAAGEIFGERGFRAGTIREITSRAGVNVAAVNYHFRDKEELYAATLRHAIEATVNRDHQIDETLPPVEQLHHFISNLLRQLLDPARPAWHGQLMAREMMWPTRSLDLVVSELIQPRIACFGRIVRSIAGPSISARRLALLLASVLAQCAYYRQSAPMVRRLFPELLDAPDAIAEIALHITTFSAAGIRACAANH